MPTTRWRRRRTRQSRRTQTTDEHEQEVAGLAIRNIYSGLIGLNGLCLWKMIYWECKQSGEVFCVTEIDGERWLISFESEQIFFVWNPPSVGA